MDRVDRAEIVAPASPEAVWRVLTGPQQVAGWLPPEGMTARVEAWEAQPGGVLRVVLTHADSRGAPGKTTDATDAVTGRFLEAFAPARLVWATAFDRAAPEHAGLMTMTWTLAPAGGGTRVAVEARGVPAGVSAEDHAAALGDTLRGLARAALRR